MTTWPKREYKFGPPTRSLRCLGIFRRPSPARQDKASREPWYDTTTGQRRYLPRIAARNAMARASRRRNA